ncbi:MAG: class I SAM-dependent methyltransferase [Bacteroidota bacterium]
MNRFEQKYYESSTFWEGNMLQDAQNMERFEITKALLPADVSSLLDAGCGNGIFINQLSVQRSELSLHAMDRSESALRLVKVDKTIGDLSAMPFENASFDCISCLEVLEHLPIESFENSLKELSRISKKYLLISVPYDERLEDSYTKCPSCRTIFNYEMHLRTFNDDVFKKLLDEYGFKQIKVIKAGMSEHFKFHRSYRKLFYSEQFLVWNSPICPVCGYEDEKEMTHEQSGNDIPRLPRKLISYLSAVPKIIWPKEKKYYWIIGLFEKQQ